MPISGKRFGAVFMGAIFVLISALVACLAYIAFNSMQPTSVPEVKYAFACQDTIKCESRVLLLRGNIDDSLAKLALYHIDGPAESKAKMVCISSPGGEVDAAILIAKAIVKNGLDTCVATRFVSLDKALITDTGACGSSCTWIVLAGKKRVAFSNSVRVGFHAPSEKSNNSLVSALYRPESNRYPKIIENQIREQSKAKDLDKNSLAQHLELFELAMATRPESMVTPSADALFVKYSFFTEILQN